MIGFDLVVPPFPVAVKDLVASSPPLIDLPNHFGVALGLVGEDCARLIQSGIVHGLPEKGSRRLSIAPFGQPKVDQLTALIDRTPKITPRSSNADICLINMPGLATPGPPAKRLLGNFWPKLLDPTKDGRRIHIYSALTEHVPDISIGERISAIPTDGQKNYLSRIPVVLEWIALHGVLAPREAIAHDDGPLTN